MLMKMDEGLPHFYKESGAPEADEVHVFEAHGYPESDHGGGHGEEVDLRL